MGNHPVQEHIERFVRREATIVDMLAIAQHIDGCYDCRRIAAALEGEMSQSRIPREMGSVTEPAYAIWWTIVLVFGTALAAALLLAYK